MPPYTGYIVETFVTLLAVCALALVVLWSARRLGLGRPSGAIELYGHLPLDGRRSIYLVKVGAQVFIVGVGESGMTKLGETPADMLAVPPSTRGPRFADVLGRRLAGARLDGAAGEASATGRATEDAGSRRARHSTRATR